MKKKGERAQITRIRNERGHITTDLTEIKSESIRRYYEQLYPKKLDNLDEMGKLLERHKLLRLTQEEIENLNRPITSKEIDLIIRKFPTK